MSSNLARMVLGNMGHEGNNDRAMHKVSAFLRRWPRMSAGCGFGAAGIALSTLWWSPVIFQAQSALPFVLFLALPGAIGRRRWMRLGQTNTGLVASS